MKNKLYRGFTAFCVIVFVVSLFSIESGLFPIITLLLSEAWIIHVLRKHDDEVFDDVDEDR